MRFCCPRGDQREWTHQSSSSHLLQVSVGVASTCRFLHNNLIHLLSPLQEACGDGRHMTGSFILRPACLLSFTLWGLWRAALSDPQADPSPPPTLLLPASFIVCMHRAETEALCCDSAGRWTNKLWMNCSGLKHVKQQREQPARTPFIYLPADREEKKKMCFSCVNSFIVSPTLSHQTCKYWWNIKGSHSASTSLPSVDSEMILLQLLSDAA